MSRRYLLDTDTVSYALRGVAPVGTRLLQHRPSELCVSAITLSELRYGADLRRSRRLHALIDGFTKAIDVVPFDADAAARFGKIASTLSGSGARIGELDTLIAAHALALGLVLVTNNTRHVSRVTGLHLENWA